MTEENERRYQESISDVKDLKKQMDNLSGNFGTLQTKLGKVSDLEGKVDGLERRMHEVGHQINKLDSSLERMLEVLKGSDLYPDGMVKQVSKTREMMDEMRTKITDIERKIDKKNLYVNALWALAALVGTLLVKTVWDYFTTKKP
jgi:peptidoglycan hydrolase CwlO-like protein